MEHVDPHIILKSNEASRALVEAKVPSQKYQGQLADEFADQRKELWRDGSNAYSNYLSS